MKKDKSIKTSNKKTVNKKHNKKKNGLFKKIDNKFKKIERRIFKDSDNSNFSLFEVIIIILISILFGVIIGYLITFSKGSSASDSNIEEIVETYHNIVDEYYDNVDKDKISEAAIKGMIDSLEDPYSNYMDTDTTGDFNEQIEGTFVGIGVVVQYTGEYNTIIEVYKGGPAKKVGLKKNDIIIKVDGEDVKNVHGDEIAKKIRGVEGTHVVITVRRGEEELEFDVSRGKIDIPSVSTEIFERDDKKIGYLRIESFAANTYTQFNKALKKLEKKKIDSLILDVRSNPGGHLLQTRQILSLFFDKKTVLYQVQAKKTKKKVYSLSNDKREYPIVVLIDSGSASASEILASCFKENYKNINIIGNKSYGKGTVQKSKSLNSGTSIKYTTEKWLTSKGKWINKKGVKPNIEVSLGEEYVNNPGHDTDAQLQKAIEILKESK